MVDAQRTHPLAEKSRRTRALSLKNEKDDEKTAVVQRKPHRRKGNSRIIIPARKEGKK